MTNNPKYAKHKQQNGMIDFEIIFFVILILTFIISSI